MLPENDRPSHPAHRVTTQLLVGLFVIAFGLLMTFDNLGLVRAEQYMQFWPGGLVAVGLLKLWQSRDGGGAGVFGGLIFTTIGTWLLLEQTAVVDLSFWKLWPALIVVAGGFLVWQGVAGPRPRTVSRDRSLFSVIAVLGGVSRGSNSPDFRGGDLTAVLGGCEIDLRQAAIDGEAVLDVFALCGARCAAASTCACRRTGPSNRAWCRFSAASRTIPARRGAPAGSGS
jgi:hypothetical protein